MAHYGSLRDFHFGAEVDDVRGSELYGRNDEKLGEIKDIIFDHATGNIRYAVVDTGGWLKSREFLVPADRIHPRPQNASDFAVDLTKEQVERFPPYNESILEQQSDFNDYEQRYRKGWDWDSGPVLHREGSNHIVTPEPEELPAENTDIESTEGFNVTPTRIADPFGEADPNPNKIRLRPAGLAARAEDQRLPGAEIPAEKPVSDTATEENRRAAETSRAVPNTGQRDTIFGLYDNAPQAEDTNPVFAQQDHLTNPDDIYTPAAERSHRLTSFEELLRRNRVDITARCGSCAVVRDKDKAA